MSVECTDTAILIVTTEGLPEKDPGATRKQSLRPFGMLWRFLQTHRWKGQKGPLFITPSASQDPRFTNENSEDLKEVLAKDAEPHSSRARAGERDACLPVQTCPLVHGPVAFGTHCTGPMVSLWPVRARVTGGSPGLVCLTLSQPSPKAASCHF